MKNVFALISALLFMCTVLTAQYSHQLASKEINYFEKTPYSNFPEYVEYFAETAKKFEKAHGVPYELILSKAWTETHAGRAGAGRNTAIFGIKGKGVKGYDSKEKQKVEYRTYRNRWEAYSDFCKVVKNKMYVDRYKAWEQLLPNKPDWYIYNLALQNHPNKELGRSAYASCGCKSGLNESCFEERMEHALKNIRLIEKHIINKGNIAFEHPKADR